MELTTPSARPCLYCESLSFAALQFAGTSTPLSNRFHVSYAVTNSVVRKESRRTVRSLSRSTSPGGTRRPKTSARGVNSWSSSRTRPEAPTPVRTHPTTPAGLRACTGSPSTRSSRPMQDTGTLVPGLSTSMAPTAGLVCLSVSGLSTCTEGKGPKANMDGRSWCLLVEEGLTAMSSGFTTI